MINIKINNKEYKVKEASTLEEKAKGLLGISSLPEDEGMIFYFDPPQKVSFWMKDTKIPLDIVFINEEYEVIKVLEGKPNDETPITADGVSYVLEVNPNSGIEEGDTLDIEETEPVMKVLFLDGTEQYQLWGGERIVSRRETKILVKKAKKAEESLEDKDFKALGKYMFKVLKGLDERPAEYVESPDKKES